MSNKSWKLTYSIITAAYNSQNYIKKCLESVINANYNLKYIEHIVVDDGSTDNTAKIVKEYASKYPHIKYFHKKNGNWGSVINFVKHNKLANNKYIVILDSDDIVTKNAFNVVAKKSKNADVFYGSYYMTNFKHKNFLIHPLYSTSVSRIVPSYNKAGKKYSQMYLCSSLPCNQYIKNEIFYKTKDLKEKVPYQDIVLSSNLCKLSRLGRWSHHSVAKYYFYRPGNSMSSRSNADKIKAQINAYKTLAKNNHNEIIFCLAMINKKLRDYALQHNVKFEIKDDIYLKWWPPYVRPFLNPMVKKFQKNLCIIKKQKGEK